MRIAIIGAGNMGFAIYRRLIQIYPVKSIWLLDPHPEKTKTALCKTNDIETIKTEVDTIIFAIKPQSFANWDTLLKEHLIISIMSGITLKTLEEKTGSCKIIRSMPNIALEIGESVTGWVCTTSLNKQDKELAKSLFSSFGYEIQLQNESMIDSLTAISGSGPAYFFYLCELMVKKALEYGFDLDIAKKLVTQTALGASLLLKENTTDAFHLRQKVTSSKGTTHAAINELIENNFPKILSKALDAAKNRARELSK